MRQVPRMAPGRIGTGSARPPRPWSSTMARRYSTPSGRRDHEGQRQARDGRALRVAQERRREHGLAGPVDAALGEHEGVDGARRAAALHAAVGEVEGGGRDRESRNPCPPSRRRGPAQDRLRRGRGRDRRRHGPARRSSSSRGSRCCGRRAGPRRCGPVRRWRASARRTWTPSAPLKAVRPRSETTNHCVARVS